MYKITKSYTHNDVLKVHLFSKGNINYFNVIKSDFVLVTLYCITLYRWTSQIYFFERKAKEI